MEKIIKKPAFPLFLFLASLPLMTGVFYSAALPELTRYFGLTTSFGEMTLYLYVVGFAIGSLIVPPLATRFGRKIGLYIGLLICSIGNLFCLSSSWFYLSELIAVGRVIQAIGACSGIIICLTQLNECYEREEKAKILSLFMIFQFIPTSSILVGGYLTKYFGWQSCFVFLFVFTLILWILSKFYVFETLEKTQEGALCPKVFFPKYAKEFKNPITLLCGFTLGLTISFVYIFSGTSPFIAINTLGYEPERFGLFFLMPATFFVIGSFFGAALSKKFSRITLIYLGASIMFVSALVLFISFLLGHVSLFVIFGSYSVIVIGFVLTASMCAALIFENSDDPVNAASVLNFVALSYSVVPVVILSIVEDSIIYQMPVLFLSQIIVIFILTTITRSYLRKKGKL